MSADHEHTHGGETYSVGVDCGLAATGGRKVVWAVGGTSVARQGGLPDIAYPASPRGLLCKVRLSAGQEKKVRRLTKASRPRDTERLAESGVSVMRRGQEGAPSQCYDGLIAE